MLNALGLIKKAAVEAVQAQKPCGIYFGTVVCENPLKIQIEQNLTLTEPFLVFARTSPDIYRAGDKLVLIRMQGGQQFVVMSGIKQQS